MSAQDAPAYPVLTGAFWQHWTAMKKTAIVATAGVRPSREQSSVRIHHRPSMPLKSGYAGVRAANRKPFRNIDWPPWLDRASYCGAPKPSPIVAQMSQQRLG